MKRAGLILAVSLFYLSGCASSPGERKAPAGGALVGHWEMADGSGHVYFSADGTYRFIDEHGNLGRALYRVIEEDKGERTITTRIRLVEYNGRPVEEGGEITVTGQFSEDYRTHFGKSVDAGSGQRPFVMEYVDAEEKP